MLAHDLALNRVIEVRRTVDPARRRQCQGRGASLRLAAQREQQRHQAHRIVGGTAAQALGHGGTLAGDPDFAHPPVGADQPHADAAGVEPCRHSLASGK
jgi:hypothetical protein